MEKDMDPVYCYKCRFWRTTESTVEWIQMPDFRYETFPTKNACDGICVHVVDKYRTPVRCVLVCGDLMVLNINNACPHYKPKPVMAKEEPKRPRWKFCRSKGE